MNSIDDINYYYPGMTPDRYKFLMENSAPEGGKLTQEESKEWHFCANWDGLLIHEDDIESDTCVCGWKERIK